MFLGRFWRRESVCENRTSETCDMSRMLDTLRVAAKACSHLEGHAFGGYVKIQMGLHTLNTVHLLERSLYHTDILRYYEASYGFVQISV